jgi:phage gp36-like protein
MYATYAEFLKIIGSDEMITLTVLDNADEPNQAVAEEALQDASDKINAYLTNRYSLPLSKQPDVLRRPAIDIAIYNLASSHSALTEDMTARYKDAISFLKDISRNIIGLGSDEPESSIAKDADGSENVMFDAPPDRMMTRDRLKGM